MVQLWIKLKINAYGSKAFSSSWCGYKSRPLSLNISLNFLIRFIYPSNKRIAWNKVLRVKGELIVTESDDWILYCNIYVNPS